MNIFKIASIVVLASGLAFQCYAAESPTSTVQHLSKSAVSSLSQNATQQASTSTSSMININTADVLQLTKLRGIGVKKAQEIVEYRKQHGPFKTINSLAGVRGISQHMVNEWKNQITA